MLFHVLSSYIFGTIIAYQSKIILPITSLHWPPRGGDLLSKVSESSSETPAATPSRSVNKARARSPFAALFEMLLCSSVQSVATARLLSTNFMPGDKQLLHSKKSRELETRVDHHNRKTHLSSWNLKGQAKVHKFFRLSQRLTKWCPKLSMQHSSYVRVGGCNTDEVCYLCSWPPWVGVSGFQYCRGQITVRIFGFKPQFV